MRREKEEMEGEGVCAHASATASRCAVHTENTTWRTGLIAGSLAVTPGRVPILRRDLLGSSPKIDAYGPTEPRLCCHNPAA